MNRTLAWLVIAMALLGLGACSWVDPIEPLASQPVGSTAAKTTDNAADVQAWPLGMAP